MKTQKQETCEDRIEWHLEARLNDLKAMLNPSVDDITLIDDGTLDTVIEYLEEELRYSDTSEHRDESGVLDLDSFFDEIEFDLQEIGYEQFCEYGLCFDYVPPSTFKDQEQGYFRYQISWGGPSEEFRFYTGPDGSPSEYDPYKIEFWFLDWWDGASRTVHGPDFDLLITVWEQYRGVVDDEFNKALEV